MGTVFNLKSWRTAPARRRALWAVAHVLPIVVAAVFLTALLPGCGSSNSSSPSKKNTSTPTPTATPTSTVSALWVPNAGGNSVDSFTLAQLSTGGNLTPSVDISGSNTQLAMPEGMCFDPSGNLWVVNCVGSKQPSSIVEFAAAGLATGGNLTPATVISGSNTTLICSVTCDFDSAGNMWVVSDDGIEQIAEFTPLQLASGGNATPAVTFDGNSYLCNSAGLLFDPSGNLWASGLCFNNLSGLSPSQLTSGGNVTPDYEISGGNATLNQPFGITFDASGNLWVANSAENGGTPGALEFAASDLATGGNIAPAVTVAGANTLMNTPQGVAVDPSGNLWVAQGGSNALTGYNASALASGGNATPFSVISGSNTKLSDPFTIRFH